MDSRCVNWDGFNVIEHLVSISTLVSRIKINLKLDKMKDIDEVMEYLQSESYQKRHRETVQNIGRYYKAKLMEENKPFLEKMEEMVRNDVPRYVVGCDSYTGGMGRSYAGNIFPVIKLQEQLNKVKQSKMKEKKFYHTFDFKDRKITICLLLKQTRGVQNDMATMFVGYSVCHPDDTYQTELAKKIAVGRAEKESSRIEEFSYDVPTELAFDLTILKGFATRFERLIKNGTVTIKGIVDVNKTE